MLLLARRGKDAPERGQCGLVAPSTGTSCPPLLLRAQLQFSIYTCVPTPPLMCPLASMWPYKGQWLTCMWSLHQLCTQAL